MAVYFSPKFSGGGVGHASCATRSAVLPPTSLGPDRGTDRASRAGPGAAPGPVRQDRDARQATARAAPPGAAVPEPPVPALGRVPAGDGRPPLIPAQANQMQARPAAAISQVTATSRQPQMSASENSVPSW